MDRIGRSWRLVRASWGVLRQDKELVAYPVISSLVALVAAAVLVLPIVLSGRLTEDGSSLTLVDLVLLFLWYVLTYAITIFFNAALVGAADIRLRGGDPTFADGLRIAVSRLPAILGWAVIAATVGMILRSIAERGGVLGALAASVAGFAWNLVTFLVVPVLVVEGVGPIEAARRSGSLLRRTWGEQIAGNVSVGLVFGIAMIGVAVVGGLAAAFLAGVSVELGVVAAVALVIGLVVLGVLAGTLGTIFSAALYRYAATGTAGPAFDEETLRATFRQR